MPRLTPVRIALMLGLAFSAARFGGCTYFQLIDARAIDFRLINRGPEKPHPAVVVVAVDDQSLEEYGRWPWSRELMAQLYDTITAAEPGAVGFDIVQSEPTRIDAGPQLPDAFPGVDAATWQQVKKQFTTTSDPDRLFAESVGRFDRTVLGYYFDFAGEGEPDPDLKFATYTAVQKSPSGKGEHHMPSATVATPNIPIITQAGKSAGYFNTLPDRGDGIFRRVPMGIRYGDRVALPLSLAMLKAARPKDPMLIRFADFGVERILVGPRVLPVAEDGQMLVNFRGPGRTFPHISAGDLLAGRVDPKVLNRRLIVVGVTATAVGDIRATPFDGVYPGVEIHATVIDNILTGRFLQQPKWVVLIEIGAILFSVLALGIGMHWLRGLWAAVLGLFLIGAYLYGSQVYFVSSGIPLGLAYPLLAIVATYMGIALFHFLGEEKEKRMIRGAFSSYLSPEMVEIVSADPSKLKLGGEKKTLSVLFSDIRGFTTISEQFDPESLTTLINRFLTPMSHAILDQHGTIDKYIGDAIMAFWNAPLDDEQHAVNACTAATNLNRLLLPLNDELEKEAAETGRKHIPLRAGIGINTGDAVVGNMGSDVRFDYSLLGDAVNLAARLEGLTKQYAVGILISEATRLVAPDFATLEADLVRVKGKTEPVCIHTLLGEPTIAVSAEFKQLAEAHARMLAAYRACDWDTADALIAECRTLSFDGLTVDPDQQLDGFYDMYEQRIVEFRAAPPPQPWDGVYTATSK